MCVLVSLLCISVVLAKTDTSYAYFCCVSESHAKACRLVTDTAGLKEQLIPHAHSLSRISFQNSIAKLADK